MFDFIGFFIFINFENKYLNQFFFLYLFEYYNMRAIKKMLVFYLLLTGLIYLL